MICKEGHWFKAPAVLMLFLFALLVATPVLASSESASVSDTFSDGSDAAFSVAKATIDDDIRDKIHRYIVHKKIRHYIIRQAIRHHWHHHHWRPHPPYCK